MSGGPPCWGMLIALAKWRSLSITPSAKGAFQEYTRNGSILSVIPVLMMVKEGSLKADFTFPPLCAKVFRQRSFRKRVRSQTLSPIYSSFRSSFIRRFRPAITSIQGYTIAKCDSSKWTSTLKETKINNCDAEWYRFNTIREYIDIHPSSQQV